MHSDGVVDTEISVALMLKKDTLENLVREAEAQGVHIDTLVSLAVEMQFDPRSVWDQLGYPEEDRQLMRDSGITEKNFDDAYRGRADLKWTLTEEDLKRRARNARTHRISELPKTHIHPDDLRVIVKDGEHILTAYSLLTFEQHEAVKAYWNSQPLESQLACRDTLTKATDAILEGIAGEGTKGQPVSGDPGGTQ